MSNYKNLKKVIAVSSMAAATIGASTMVNADNVQSSALSQKPSIAAKASTEAQSVKSNSKVVLKSSQSSVASKKTASSSQSAAKKEAQPMNATAKVAPTVTDAQHSTIQNDINSVNDTIKKYQSDDSLAVSTASTNFGTDIVVDALNGYISGLDTKSDLEKDVQKVQNVLNDDKDALAKETNAHAKEIIEAQVKLDQDAYDLLSQALKSLDGNVAPSQTSSSTGSSSSNASDSSSNDDSKTNPVKKSSESPQFSEKSSVSVKNDGVKSSAKNGKVNNGTKAAVKTTGHKAAAVSNKKAATKHTTASSTKKSSMPQTGEQTSKVGILAGIGAVVVAAAGAFLLRKRG